MISVIINVYNGEKYIKRCLDSIINQTYKNLDILIINDGSTDKTLSICKKYKDKRIRIINQQNKGLALSRNVGIENAKGDYLYFVDADDYIELDTIEYLYNLCKKYDALIATCKSIDFYQQPYIINKKESIKIMNSYDFLKKLLLITERDVAIWNKLIKKELFGDLRFENRITDDIIYTYRIILKNNRIIYSNQIKYYYFKHNESISTCKKEQLASNIDMYNAYIQRYNEVKEIYPYLIENEIGFMQFITRLYLRKNKDIIAFYYKKKMFNKYKELFSLKILFSSVKTKEKIKLFLFRISPKFHNLIINNYLRMVGKND